MLAVRASFAPREEFNHPWPAWRHGLPRRFCRPSASSPSGSSSASLPLPSPVPVPKSTDRPRRRLTRDQPRGIVPRARAGEALAPLPHGNIRVGPCVCSSKGEAFCIEASASERVRPPQGCAVF